MKTKSASRIAPLILSVSAGRIANAQNTPPPPKIDLMTVPDIAIQTEDYAKARSSFHTKLLKQGPAPYQDCAPKNPPQGVSEIQFLSGPLRLTAWVNRPPREQSTQIASSAVFARRILFRLLSLAGNSSVPGRWLYRHDPGIARRTGAT